MKKTIDLKEYSNLILEALSKGILLNTDGEKFNTMVIGWGHLGTLWGIPSFVAYVRHSRYTKSQVDETGEFTLSVPLGGADPLIGQVCGSLSGRDTDKVKEAGLTLEPPRTNRTPGIRQYPLTIECRVIYTQEPVFENIPEGIRERMYPREAPGTSPAAERDLHTIYVGRIVDAYIIE